MAKQFRIAVVGKTGNGKSSVANSIIGKNIFKTGLSANRITKVTSSRTKRLHGHDIVVSDTPGLYQEGEDESEIKKEIEKSIVSPGLHAVVFVIKIGRFTKEEQEAVEQMKTLFGTSIFRFTIFAFTCINDLGTQSLEGFVHERAPVYLKDVISRSGSRIVGFDNRDETMDKQSVKDIISLVEDISHTNKECLYSRVLFEGAFQAKMKRKKEEQEKKEIERKLEFEKATAEKEAALKKKHEDDRNTIAKRQDQITSEQQQYLQETAEKERLSIERVNSESLKEIEEKLKSGTNDLIADMNLKTEVSLDTQPEAKGPLPDSTDPQHFKGETQLTSVLDTEVHGTNDPTNLKTRAASDTQLEAKGPLLDSEDPHHFKGENHPTKSGKEEGSVAKGGKTTSEMKASVTMNDAGRDVRDTEVHGPVLHAEEDQTRDTSETALKESLDRRTTYIQREQESYDIPPNELRSNGKNSTADTIIGKDIFRTGATATSTPKETDTYQASRFGKGMLLADTTGLFDQEIETKETENKMEKHEELHERIIEERNKRLTLEHELKMTKEVRIEGKRKKSGWFRFGKFMGLYD